MLHGRLTSRRLARTSGLTLLAAAALAAAAPVAAEAAFPGQDGRITSLSHFGLISAVQRDGTGLRKLVGVPGDGWNDFNVTGQAVAPDGQRLVFSARETCDANCDDWQESVLAVVSLDGGAPAVIWSDSREAPLRGLRNPSWSPDGKQIVAAGGEGDDDGLFVIPVDGGAARRVALPASVGTPDEPAFSPDATRIAFSGFDAGDKPRVYVVPVAGGDPVKLTTGGDGQTGPSWSPDGTRIAYVNQPFDGVAQLAARPVDGGAQDILFSQQSSTNGAIVGGRPAWSPSGDRVAFSVTRTGAPFTCGGEIRWVSVETSTAGGLVQCQESRFAHSVDWGVRPQPGETRLASRARGSERQGGDGGADAVALTRGGRFAFYTSSATDTLDGIADDNGARDVFRRDLASGDVALVSGGAHATAAGASDTPVAGADGRWVAFRSTAHDVIAGYDGEAAVYERDMDSGAITLVSRRDNKPKAGIDGTPLAISDDGRYVLFATPGKLLRFDRQTGATATVADAPTGAARMTPNGRYVAFESNAGTLVDGFADHNGAAPSIFRTDLDTGTTVLVDGRDGGLADSTTGEAGSHLRGLSADGSTVLFANGDEDPLAGFDDANGAADDLFLRRLADPEPYVASASRFDAKRGAHGAVGAAELSADGRLVLFTSDANDLLQSFRDNDGAGADVFLRRFDPAGDEEATLVTLGAGGSDTTADGASAVAGLSADGRFALVRSRANDLTSALEPHDRDVLFRIDLRSHVVTVVTELDNQAPEADVTAPAISGDGRTIAYLTGAGNVMRDFLDRNDAGTDAFGWVDHTIADVDVIAPDIRIETPAEGGIYRKDRIYEARYSCRDVGGSGLDTCAGTADAGAPIDTDTLGDKQFTVTATDRAGNTTTRTVVYRVALANDHLSLLSGDGTAGASEDSAKPVVGGDFAAYQSGSRILRRDLRTGEQLLVAAGSDPRISADGRFVAFVAADGKLSVRDVQAATTRVVYGGETAEHAISGDGSTVVYTAGGAVYRENTRLADGEHPQVSADGKRVLYLAQGHLRLWDGGTTMLVDHAFGKAVPAAGDATGGILSADGSTVLFGSTAANVAGAYHGEGEQLYRVSAAGGDAKLVTASATDPAEGTGGHIAGARLSGDGGTAAWQSLATNVVAGFADHNGIAGEDLYARTDMGPARLVAHGDTPQDGVSTHPTLHAISGDGRFVLYGLWALDADSEADDPRADLRRTDLLRDRVSAVASSPLTGLFGVSMNAAGRRIAFSTTSANMIDGFQDGNGDEGGDVYGWFDKPPVAGATARITGPLALAFDGSGSTDSDGRILTYRWDFGDGQGSPAVKPAHAYADEDSFTVTLTVEDDGSNEVSYTFEVVAIKGVLTAGAQPLDFLGVDKHLRCSAVRGGAIFAGGGGECGTFVALGGAVYGPPDLVAGVTPYTPVRQDVSQDGAVAKLVTVVALGTTGVQVRQTDQYVAGTGWYRTDVALVNAGGAAQDATVYRAAHCVSGHPVHDAGAAMAGCDVADTIAALLPLTPGAHHEAGGAVLAHLGAGAMPDDTSADTGDPSMAIAWAVSVPAHGEATRGSLGAFGPDGTIPLTVALKPDKDQVQPLDENAFTVTVRNANGVARDVGPIVADAGGVWDYTAGSTTGLTTADPVAGTWAGPFSIAGHAKGELRFGVTHRNGTRVAITTATAAPAAGVTSTGIADLGEAKAAVDARPIEGSVPNTAIFDGPTGPTNDAEPVFSLVASKDTGVRYECRYVPAGWEDCESDYRPGPLPDGTYRLEVRAVDAFGTDETPATRTFTVDTVAPSTVIASGSKKVTSANRAGFELRASESGSRFECRLDGGAWFRCSSPWTTDALADGEHRFEARAIDAAGNADPTPAAWTFRVDTTPPVTVIDGVTGRVVRPSGAASASAAGSTLTLGSDGAAALSVSCPAAGTACSGTVGLAMESPSAGIARVVPSGAITLARAEFTAQPGQTVRVRLAVSMATRNQLERIGRMAVFPTLDLGAGRPVRGDDVVLMPDPRTARLLDAGRELKVVKGAVTLRLKCAKTCTGTVAIGRHAAKFSGRAMKVRVRVGSKRGTQSVRITTKPAPTKRLTVTLKAKEARR